MRLFGMVILLASATPASAAPPASTVEEARAQVEALDFKAAAKTLDRARSEHDLSRSEVLAYYELRGIVAGTLNDARAATEAFRALLTLEPEARLRRGQSPRVMTPFYEAKSWVGEHGGLTLERASPRLEGGRVKGLGVRVRDPVGLVTAVRVHVLEGAGPWRVASLPKAGGEVPCDSESVAFWIELEAEREWILLTDGSESAPLRIEARAPVPVVETPKLLPTPPPAPPPVVIARAPEPRFRPAAWTLVGVGAGALVAGAVLGLVANGERQRFTSAVGNSTGTVTGLTRQQALDLDAAVRTHGTAANVLFAAGGALAAGGAGLWLAGTLSPVPGGGAGVTVGGTFP